MKLSDILRGASYVAPAATSIATSLSVSGLVIGSLVIPIGPIVSVVGMLALRKLADVVDDANINRTKLEEIERRLSEDRVSIRKLEDRLNTIETKLDKSLAYTAEALCQYNKMNEHMDEMKKHITV